MQIVGIVVLIVAVVLVFKFWYVTVPLVAIAAVGFAINHHQSKKRLAAMEPSEREAYLEQRQVKAAAARRQAELRQAARQDLQRHNQARRAAAGTARTAPISEVGRTDAGVLACPHCGGSQFKARRSNTKRVTLAATAAIATPLTRQTQVQCVTCGAKYKRG